MRELLKPIVGPVALLALKEGLSASGYPMSPFWGGVLVGFAGFWFVLAVVSHKALIKRFPGIRTWMPFVDPAGAVRDAKELTSRYIAHQTFSIADLAINGRIEGRTFEDCDIYGPAVVHVTGIGHIHESIFDSMNSFIVTAQDKVVGPILAKDCSFRGCRFHGVGFIGPEAQMKHFARGIDPSPLASQSPPATKRDR